MRRQNRQESAARVAQAVRNEIRRVPAPTPAVKTAQSLIHKAGLRAFLAGKTTIPREAPPRHGPGYAGNLNPNRY